MSTTYDVLLCRAIRTMLINILITIIFPSFPCLSRDTAWCNFVRYSGGWSIIIREDTTKSTSLRHFRVPQQIPPKRWISLSNRTGIDANCSHRRMCCQMYYGRSDRQMEAGIEGKIFTEQLQRVLCVRQDVGRLQRKVLNIVGVYRSCYSGPILGCRGKS